MIELVPMTAEQYEDYLDILLPDYAQEHVKAGNWAEEGALERAREEMDTYLPDGVATDDHYLYTLVDPELNAAVGILWYAIRGPEHNRQAFVYDIKIDDQFRRRGYASQAFQKMETMVKEMGINVIGLHVFGNNYGAIAMYEKLGFEVTDLMMRKWL
jgi:ribosomal protein S18 acetylase RimI-like enzyme